MNISCRGRTSLNVLLPPPKHGSNYRLKSISMYKSQPYQPIKYLRFFASDNKFKLYFYSVTISLTLRLITNCFILNCWVGFSLTWFFAPEQLTIRSFLNEHNELTIKFICISSADFIHHSPHSVVGTGAVIPIGIRDNMISEFRTGSLPT